MSKSDPTDFAGFCRQATDSQLRAILQKEWEGRQRDPDRRADYRRAVVEANRRGWSVSKGQVV